MSLRKLYYLLHPRLRYLSRKMIFIPVDIYHFLLNKRHKYEPPKGDIFIGSGDFIEAGNKHLNLLVNHLELKKSDNVLDIGCGLGRTAIPLTTYLNKTSKYEGFDVVKKGITWCNSKIKKDFPNFNFKYIPLHNDLYNTSSQTASQYKFPYDSNSFEVVFLFSVFTHMKISEIDNYLKEIHRVLKPKGKCLATFFLYNDDNEAIVSSIKEFSFPVKRDGYRLMNEKVESANILINESNLINIIDNSGLKLKKKFHGFWKDQVLGVKSVSGEFQDFVILEK